MSDDIERMRLADMVIVFADNKVWLEKNRYGHQGFSLPRKVLHDIPSDRIFYLVNDERLPANSAPEPVPVLLHCPLCHERHIDEGEFATKPHHTHACQSCGHCWRPAIVPTIGVQFLPGFKDALP